MEKLEIGKKINTFEQVQSLIQKGDIDIEVKAGIVVSAKMGSLAVMRDALERYLDECGGGLIFFTMTPRPIYVVHYNDLSPQKQIAVGKREVKQP